MSFQRIVDLSVDGDLVVKLEVEFTENENGSDQFRVAVRRFTWGEADAEAVWHVQEHNGRFNLQITSQHVASGICLAGCLAGIVTSAGPLVDCLRKANNRKDVRNCINKHGLWQAVGSLSCIYGCLNL